MNPLFGRQRLLGTHVMRPRIASTACSIALALALAPTAWGLGLPYLVRDVNPGSSDSNPFSLAAAGNRLFFAADDGTDGVEPWGSDGTTPGTQLLQDIVAGSGSSMYLGHPVVSLGNYAYFLARNDSNFSDELWRSDGTAPGTERVAADVSLYDMAKVGSSVYFTATTTTSNGYRYLFTSDGTPGNAQPVTGVLYGGPSGQYLTDVDGVAFFPASDDTHGQELWRSNGTTGGTALVKDIQPGGSSSSPMFLTNVNGVLFFFADDGTGQGLQLWRSDGSDPGTFKLGGRVTSSGSLPGPQIANLDGTAMAILNDGVHGSELWRSDGTVLGTSLVRDINPGAAGGLQQSGLVVMGNKVYFRADDGSTGSELWQSDGTYAGTSKVLDINPYGSSSPSSMVRIGDRLFFGAIDGLGATNPWTSDGTAAGTMKLAALYSPVFPQSFGFTYAGGLVYFAARDIPSGSGVELWAVGGVTAVGEPGPAQAGLLDLAQNQPNPVRSTTTLSYTLPAAEQVELTIFDVNGREMTRPVHEQESAGAHHLNLDASRWTNGVYFVRLHAGDRSLERKMVVLR